MLLQLSAFILLLFCMSLNIPPCHICSTQFPLCLISVQLSPRLFPQPHLPRCFTATISHGQHCRSPRLCPHLQDLVRCQTTVWMPLIPLMYLDWTPDLFGSLHRGLKTNWPGLGFDNLPKLIYWLLGRRWPFALGMALMLPISMPVWRVNASRIITL